MSPTLVSLPPEILFNVLSYSSPFNPTLLPLHPLYTLAASNSYLRSVVEEFARGLLKQHASINMQIVRRGTGVTRGGTQRTVCRHRWMKWLKSTCWHCRRKSERAAILDATMTCCKACDRRVYPKMTMTDATTTHGLSKLDLFTPNILHPSLPPLTIGSYMCMGSDALMLSLPDVLARKSYVHGLLGPEKAAGVAYLRRRAAAHERMMMHVGYSLVLGKWSKNPDDWYKWRDDGRCRSLQTKEGREQYVKEALEREWAVMGMDIGGERKMERCDEGKTEESAVVVD
ncbi:hypothetical protein BCR34DRAFT_558571 [Clohesyomyces aquaticus]|uniref:F-box domain-containing protein n=1 Tax=Clohesyomyces aquaticus TaxID=1231657 RepID=A0A1Y1ZZ69_9PLEO|nr:hypothetical protein BCR34DRAFT_558571 [Clohesyomyces aquaticus]